MTPLRRFRALYGAGPLNLVVLLVSLAIAGFAVAGWFQRPRDVGTVIIWFAAAIVLHDLVLLPLYSLLDRIVFGWRRSVAPRRKVLSLVGSTPYLRIPAILSGLLLIVFFPVIFGLGSQTELSASGIAESGYLARWLIASGVIFAVSGVAWAVAVGRVAARGGAAARRAAAEPASLSPAAPELPAVPPPAPEPPSVSPPAPEPPAVPPPAPVPDPRPVPSPAPDHEPTGETPPDGDAIPPASPSPD